MSLIKTLFISRYGDDGYIVQADYSQLEVVAIACLTGDGVLIQELKDGKDMHKASAEAYFQIPYDEITKENRTDAKPITFLIQYGGTSYGLSRELDIPEAKAQGYIDNYYGKYTGIKAAHDRWFLEGTNGKGLWRSPTGRYLMFPKNFNGTINEKKVKNYPGQSVATGDIVPLMLGVLYRKWLQQDQEFRDNCKLINTIHDSFIFDIHEKVLDKFYKWCDNEVLSHTNEYAKSVFGLDWPLQIKFDFEQGQKWSELESINVSV